MLKTGPKILIVDDDEEFSLVLQQCIQSLGCRTVSAANGVQALEMLGIKDIALVISDVRMPKLDGVGLLEAMNEKGFDVPVIVISGHSDYTADDIDQRNGVVLLKKPFSRVQIRELIETFFPLLATKSLAT